VTLGAPGLPWHAKDIDCLEFDVALIGAGAYGLPLAACVKRLGKKAIHMGGVTKSCSASLVVGGKDQCPGVIHR
jgi:hypothetical protein